GAAERRGPQPAGGGFGRRHGLAPLLEQRRDALGARVEVVHVHAKIPCEAARIAKPAGYDTAPTAKRPPEARMIPRYTRPEMAAIWEPQTRFRIWFEIEAHAADALAELGIIPKAAAKTIWAKGKDATFDIDRIDAIEREVRHDVIAFLTHLAEIVGPEARFVHQGMTSSDVLDTCFNVQLVRAADLLVADTDKVLAALKRRAFEH